MTGFLHPSLEILIRKDKTMFSEKELYMTPAVRVVDACLETAFLQSGGTGQIDPGTDDPWGDY